MKFLKKLYKGLFWLLIIALLLAPLALIYEISNKEQEQYQVPDPPKFVETAYGSIVQATRKDVVETVNVSGSFVSETFVYQELNYKNPSNIRWDVTVGDEVQEGQVLGTYNGEEIISQYSGILKTNNAYTQGNSYLKVQLLEPVVLECRVTQKVLNSLRRAKELTTEDGEAVTLVYTSKVKNPNGLLTVQLSIDTEFYSYGEAVEDLVLYTGYEYMQTLVLPESALYQKVAGEDEPWYAYEVTQAGAMVGEKEVTRGYSDGTYVCVTGVEAGQYFDTGYKAIKGGG